MLQVVKDLKRSWMVGHISGASQCDQSVDINADGWIGLQIIAAKMVIFFKG